MPSCSKNIETLHKELCGETNKERFKETDDAFAQPFVPAEGSESTDNGGAHIHSGENSQGLHSHPELERQIKALKAELQNNVKEPI